MDTPKAIQEVLTDLVVTIADYYNPHILYSTEDSVLDQLVEKTIAARDEACESLQGIVKDVILETIETSANQRHVDDSPAPVLKSPDFDVEKAIANLEGPAPSLPRDVGTPDAPFVGMGESAVPDTFGAGEEGLFEDSPHDPEALVPVTPPQGSRQPVIQQQQGAPPEIVPGDTPINVTPIQLPAPQDWRGPLRTLKAVVTPYLADPDPVFRNLAATVVEAVSQITEADDPEEINFQDATLTMRVALQRVVSRLRKFIRTVGKYHDLRQLQIGVTQELSTLLTDLMEVSVPDPFGKNQPLSELEESDGE